MMSLRLIYQAREFHQAWALVALPSNSSGGEEMGLAAIGTAGGAGNRCGGGGGGGAGVLVAVGASAVLALVVDVPLAVLEADVCAALGRVGDRGGTVGVVVVLVFVGTGVEDADDMGGGTSARCFPFDTGGVGT
jgi:hypothetical protein